MEAHPFGLQELSLEDGFDAEWQALVAQQVRALAGILSCLREALTDDAPHVDTPMSHAARVQRLVAVTARFLTEQTQLNVMLEKELASLRLLEQVVGSLAPEAARRLQTIEQVNAVLHGNLTIARHVLTGLFS